MTLYEELVTALRRYPIRAQRYELHCHPDVYIAIQQSDMASHGDTFNPLPALYGAELIVKPEVGRGVWKLLADGELIGYGRISARDPV